MDSKNKLKIRFRTLPHQVAAINNTMEVFNGAMFTQADNSITNPLLDMQSSHQRILENIKQVRARNGITKGECFCPTVTPLQLDILMETGTGKTFAFIEAIYNLHHLYGLAKFIILVPSNAIRKGTIKNLKLTEEFLCDKYPSTPGIEAFDYSPQKINNFIGNSNKNISVLVMTHQSFNKIGNIINKRNREGSLMGKQSYMEELAALNPVIIIDEPHKFTGSKTQEFIPKFEAQIIFRYGATFRNDYKNLIHVLDSVKAFEDNLVKSITVTGVDKTGMSNMKLCYKDWSGKAKERRAIIEYSVGTEQVKTISLAKGDNLGDKLSLNYLEGYTVHEIKKDQVIFTEAENLIRGEQQDYSGLADGKVEIMLQNMVDLHFEKEERLFKLGVKALSLVFVDSRKKYLLDDGKPGELAKIFEKIYKNKLNKLLRKRGLDKDYKAYLERTAKDVSKVHDGYFAISRKVKDEEAAIDLILEKKEELLSHSTDLRFIFSMWALQEGWDNPNVFTICKLAPNNSNITKLQQVGRGLRLAVAQTAGGFERITSDKFTQTEFEEINELDVIIPDEESAFVNDIQQEVVSHGWSSKTNFISLQKLVDLGICKNTRLASRLVDVLLEHNLIDFDDNTETGRILSNELLGDAVATAAGKGIEFDRRELAELFHHHTNLDTKVKTRSRKTNPDIPTVKKHWTKFKILWEDINSDASYDFDVDEDKLHKNIVARINKELIVPKIKYRASTTKRAEDSSRAEKSSTVVKQTPPMNFYTFHEFIKRIADETKLSFHSIIKILKAIKPEKFEILANDQVLAIQKVSELALIEINEHILDTLEFTIKGKAKGATSLTDEHMQLLSSIKLSSMGRQLYQISNPTVAKKSLTKDKMGVDSLFEQTIIDDSHMDKIDVFSKIPEIRIPIPGGSKYNPDFAYVVSEDADGDSAEKSTYHLVLESKGYEDEMDLRGSEKFKIEAAKKFFAALQASTKIKTPIKYEVMLDDGRHLSYWCQ